MDFILIAYNAHPPVLYCVGDKTMIYTENHKGGKKPCLALASVGGGLGWDLSGDVMTGEMIIVGPHKMRSSSAQCGSISSSDQRNQFEMRIITLDTRSQ